MAKEVSSPVVVGVVLAVVAVVIIVAVIMSRAPAIPEGKVDTTLPPPMPKSSNSRFRPVEDKGSGASAAQTPTRSVGM